MKKRLVKKQQVWLVSLVLLVTGTQMMAGTPALAMAGTYGKADLKQPLANSNWPPGVAALANRPERSGGHWLNANDWFEYTGDGKAFNAFLRQYATVQGTPLLLVLQNGNGEDFVTRPPDAVAVKPDFDWRLSITGWGQANATLILPLGGRIALKDLQVPVTVNVDFRGTAEHSPDVAAFVVRHKARQDKAKQGKERHDKVRAGSIAMPQDSH